MKKILLVYRTFTEFIRRDIELLSKKYNVIPIRVTPIKIHKLVSAIAKVDIIFIWFAGWHAGLTIAFAKAFGKPTALVAGGYDVACLPEINYGAFTSWWRGRLARWALNHADIVLAISNSAKKEILARANPEKLLVVHMSANAGKFKPKGKKENLVITTGNVYESNLSRKGLKTFVKAAKYLPDVKFVLIGKHFDKSIDFLKTIATKNVKFTGFLPFEDLLNYYQRAKVYVQASAHEGFGIAIAEAMLCGCIPVVTKRYAIPEVVGKHGFYVPYEDPLATAAAIRRALKMPKSLKGRKRIIKLFSVKLRKRKLFKALKLIE
jgi:glycosyltransferase involved in cell wall biosynthesis